MLKFGRNNEKAIIEMLDNQIIELELYDEYAPKTVLNFEKTSNTRLL